MEMAMGKTIAGQTFKTDKGVKFQVVEDEFWHAGEHDRSNGRYLDSLRPGLLVSAWYRAPTPLITQKDGVHRLVEVSIAGESLKGSRVISERLGIEQTRIPVTLSRK